MSNFKDINDFKKGQVFTTKKGKKMEVTDVRKDLYLGEETGHGSVELKKYVHRNSENITPKKGGGGYSWGHNTKWFKCYSRIDGKSGLLRKLQNECWSLKKSMTHPRQWR